MIRMKNMIKMIKYMINKMNIMNIMINFYNNLDQNNINKKKEKYMILIENMVKIMI